MIDRQVERGRQLVSHLNRFAHSPDRIDQKTDLAALVQQVVFLSARFAVLKEITLWFSPVSQPIELEINQVKLQMAIFAAITCCLDLLSPGAELKLDVEQQDSGIVIRLRCEGKFKQTSPLSETIQKTELWSTFRQSLESVGGGFEFLRNAEGFKLLLPRQTEGSDF